MWRSTFSLTLVALVWIAVQARCQEPTAADKNAPVSLLGDYRIESVEISGVKQPDEQVIGTLVHITEDQLLVEDKDHKSTPYIASYKLDTKKKPYVITMTSLAGPRKDETVQGLIEKDGDQLRLIYALPGGAVPTEFKSKDKQLLIVMKLVPK